MTFVATKSTLLSLPTEVQLLIYHALFSDEKQRSLHHPILQVSKKLYDTCRPIVLSHLRLYIDAWPDSQLSQGWPDPDNVLVNYTFYTPAKTPLWLDLDDNPGKKYSWQDFVAKRQLIALLPHIGSLGFHCALESNDSCCYTEYWAIVRWRCGHGEQRVESETNAVDCGWSCWVPDDAPDRDEVWKSRERAAAELAETRVLTLEVLERLVGVLTEED